MVIARRRRSSEEGRRDPPPASTGSVPSRQAFSLSETETYEMGRLLGRGLRGGELVLLEGDLGLGKTVFARGLAAGLGVAPEDVSSPSFTLIQEYRGGRVAMFHVDLYRLEEPEELSTLGIEEILSSGAVVVVEWGEKLPPFLRRGAIRIRLHDVGEGSRRIEILPDSAGAPAAPGGDA